AQDRSPRAGLHECAGAGNGVGEGESVGAIDREGAVVDDVAHDRSARAAVAELQRRAVDRRAAGIRVRTGTDDGAAALNRDGAAAADAAGIGAGEALAERQRRVVGDCRSLKAVGVADQRAAADGPVLCAAAGQRPRGSADLVEDGEALILLSGANIADVEGAEEASRYLRVAKLEGIAAGPQHVAADVETRRERQRERTGA